MAATMTDEEAIRATETWAAVGQTVRRPGSTREARVQVIDNNYAPGAVYLDTALEDLRWWNVEELEPVSKPKE